MFFQGYVSLLMYAMDQASVDPATRQSAAITFKNFIKRAWDPESGSVALSDLDRTAVKTQSIVTQSCTPRHTHTLSSADIE